MVVHGNDVFIRKKKLARNTHGIHFQCETSFPTFVHEHKANYTAGCKKLFVHVIMT